MTHGLTYEYRQALAARNRRLAERQRAETVPLPAAYRGTRHIYCADLDYSGPAPRRDSYGRMTSWRNVCGIRRCVADGHWQEVQP